MDVPVGDRSRATIKPEVALRNGLEGHFPDRMGWYRLCGCMRHIPGLHLHNDRSEDPAPHTGWHVQLRATHRGHHHGNMPGT